MKRFAIALLLATHSVCAFAQEVDQDLSPALRGRVTVASDIVRIGDLLDNAGVHARIAVFRAPDLGTTGRVPLAQVMAALREHHIDAVNTNNLDEISVTRASRAFTSKDVTARIAQVIANRYGFADPTALRVTLDRDIATLQVDPSSEPAIARLAFDQRSGRFDATLDIAGKAVRLLGHAVDTVEAVTLIRPLTRGEMVQAADVIIARQPKTELAADAIQDVQSILGLEARQPLRAGQMLRRNDLTKPELVQRNEPVIILFETSGISLSLRGKALASGSHGETIDVINLQTKRTLQAVITGPSQVTIPSFVAGTSAKPKSGAAYPNG